MWPAYSHSSLDRAMLKEERDSKLYKWRPFGRDFSVSRTPGRKCYIKPKKCLSYGMEVSSLWATYLLLLLDSVTAKWKDSHIFMNMCQGPRGAAITYSGSFFDEFSFSSVPLSCPPKKQLLSLLHSIEGIFLPYCSPEYLWLVSLTWVSWGLQQFVN